MCTCAYRLNGQDIVKCATEQSKGVVFVCVIQKPTLQSRTSCYKITAVIISNVISQTLLSSTCKPNQTKPSVWKHKYEWGVWCV